MESQPRATPDETILRMIHTKRPVPLAGFFPIHGQGAGESCPQRMKTTVFTQSKASTCHASEADRGVLPENFPESITQARLRLALGAIPICTLQTQTAYGVAGLCRYKYGVAGLCRHQ
jgi:hypothetical protein